MMIRVGEKLIEVEEFENSLALAFHIREIGWNNGQIDSKRNDELSRIATSLALASTI